MLDFFIIYMADAERAALDDFYLYISCDKDGGTAPLIS